MGTNENNVSVENQASVTDKKSTFLGVPIGIAPKQGKDSVLKFAAISPILEPILGFLYGFLNGLFGLNLRVGSALELGLSIYLLCVMIADYKFLKRMGYQLKWYYILIVPWYMYKKEKQCYGKLFWFYGFFICLVIYLIVLLFEQGPVYLLS